MHDREDDVLRAVLEDEVQTLEVVVVTEDALDLEGLLPRALHGIAGRYMVFSGWEEPMWQPG